MDLFQCPEFANSAAIANTKKQFKEHKLSIVDLGSSVALHHTGQTERQKNIDDGKRYIDLAHALGCPFVRVFPNNLPKDNTREAVMQLIISGLQQLGDYAKSSGVTVLMESMVVGMLQIFHILWNLQITQENSMGYNQHVDELP